MRNQDIAQRRLHTQHIAGTPLPTAAAVVGWLGAVQSQDYAGAKWAVAQRTNGLTDADLGRTVTIRGEPHRVQQALLRGIDHSAYHVGQILYLARLLNPTGEWLTVAPGTSRTHPGRYLKPPT